MAARKDCSAGELEAVLGCAGGVMEYPGPRPWLGVPTGTTGEATAGAGPAARVVLMVKPLPPAGTAHRARLS